MNWKPVLNKRRLHFQVAKTIKTVYIAKQKMYICAPQKESSPSFYVTGAHPGQGL
uniref:Uncharacterized protein n=1 Tax=Anguilla anguilla TaxID=7936 RepID=A0A0E9PF84_ANGAN